MSDIELLIEGFKQFRQNYPKTGTKAYDSVVQGANPPKILMIACCDSRVDPAIITNSRAGDIVVVRNIANIVPPYLEEDNTFCETKAAIEFATCYQEVEHIIIMGHSRCGGVRSLLTRLIDQSVTETSLTQWTDILRPVGVNAIKENPGATLDDVECSCSRAALGVSLANLKCYPSVKLLMEENRLDVRGWYFNLSEGTVEEYSEEKGSFRPL